MGKAIRDMTYASPNQGGSDLTYKVKYFEDTDTLILEGLVNDFLNITLADPLLAPYYVRDMQFGVYGTGVNTTYTCWIFYVLIGAA